MLKTPVPLAAILALAVATPPPARGPEHVRDLQAFFKQIDKTYPFFDTKGIRKQWRKKKAELLTRARRCRDDEAFVALVLDAARCLRDGHISFPQSKIPMPSEPEFYSGFAFLPATDGRVVVMHSPPALASVMPAGTVVTQIDGRDARAFLDARGKQAWQEGGFFSSPQRARLFEYRIALRDERGTKHELHFLDGKSTRRRSVRSDVPVKGWPHHYNLPADLAQGARSVWHTQLASGVGYVYMRRMDATAEQGLAKAVAAHPEAKGWIIDLRGNSGGGYDSSIKQIVAELTRPVVGIVDAGSVSAAETFARDLVQRADARLVGATTAGSSSKKTVWTFPSGKLGIRYSVASRIGLDGRPIEFFGITPHVEVEAIPEEVAAGRNSALLRAEELVTGKSTPPAKRRRRGP